MQATAGTRGSLGVVLMGDKNWGCAKHELHVISLWVTCHGDYLLGTGELHLGYMWDLSTRNAHGLCVGYVWARCGMGMGQMSTDYRVFVGKVWVRC